MGKPLHPPAMNEYDAVRYETQSQSDVHPDRMAVIGRLFGLEPAPVTRCRVLEVGCGDGNNLIPMSWSLPESEFVGIDLAAAPIAAGREMLDSLGITNVRLVNGNITDINESWEGGQFDYIIAHGFYSWVPPEVRDHLMNVCRRCLAPGGIAFVSYNAYPGSHMRDMMREMMLFHVREEPDAGQRIKQGKALLSLLAAAQEGRDDGRLLMEEARRTLTHTDVHLYHDDLATINQPVYFSQFIGHGRAFGMQYLGEADYFEMSDHTFPQNVRDALQGTRANRIVFEQYLDFIKCRRFRQTLLCHDSAVVLPDADPGAISQFLISSAAAAVPGEGDGETSVFRTEKGARVETDHAAGLAALSELQSRWPAAIPFTELADAVAARLGGGNGASRASAVSISGELRTFLLSIYSAGVVEFHTHLPSAANVVEERPLASPVVRWQAQRGSSVTTLHHDTLRVDDQLERRLLVMLDGTRDRASLRDGLYDFLKGQGAFAEGVSEERCREQVGVALDKNLEKLARQGLLLTNA